MSTDQKTIDWYNNNAKGYAEHVRNPNDSIYHAYYEKPAMYKLLPDLHGKTVISLGCGTGEDSSNLKKQGASKSVGVDISEAQIEIAKSSYPECEFRVMDMEKLDFEDESFDFAYSSLALSYVKNWSKLLAEAYRVLKPGSEFLFSCEHPVVTAMEFKEQSDEQKVWSLRIERNKKAGVANIEGDYLHQHPTPVGISIDVTTWHRSFNQMFSEISGAGFAVKNLVEPLPLPEMKKLSPSVYKALSFVPDFLIMQLEKLPSD